LVPMPAGKNPGLRRVRGCLTQRNPPKHPHTKKPNPKTKPPPPKNKPHPHKKPAKVFNPRETAIPVEQSKGKRRAVVLKGKKERVKTTLASEPKKARKTKKGKGIFEALKRVRPCLK